MKKTAIIVVLIWCLILTFVWPYRVKAHADALTVTEIAGLAYAIGQYSGLNFGFENGTANGVRNAMESYINHWLQGRTIIEAFGADVARIVGGRLIVPFTLFNNIRNFLNDIVSDNNLESGDAIIFPGEIDGTVINNLNQNFGKTDIGFSVEARTTAKSVNCDFYYNGSNSYGGGFYWAGTGSFDDAQANGWTLTKYEGNKVYIAYVYSAYRTDLQQRQYFTKEKSATIPNLVVSDTGTGSISEGYTPTVLDPTQEWSSGSYVGPDTNLDDLMDSIFGEVADNNLDVDGEVIDIPVPPGPVPTWTPVDDVIDGINQTGEILEGIGNDIGDISGNLDDIGDKIDDVTGALEGVQEGIQTQTGVISGAMEQATQDIVDAIGEQTAALDETLIETAEGVQDIVEALQPGQINPRQFDLRGIFPFCIPFDIHNLLQKFQAAPVAPHVQLPFVIQSIGFSYTFDFDFSVFDSVAAVMRTVEFIVFAIGLAWATSKVIKW